VSGTTELTVVRAAVLAPHRRTSSAARCSAAVAPGLAGLAPRDGRRSVGLGGEQQSVERLEPGADLVERGTVVRGRCPSSREVDGRAVDDGCGSRQRCRLIGGAEPHGVEASVGAVEEDPSGFGDVGCLQEAAAGAGSVTAGGEGPRLASDALGGEELDRGVAGGVALGDGGGGGLGVAELRLGHGQGAQPQGDRAPPSGAATDGHLLAQPARRVASWPR
jgi:hypothetical protein